jgi:hypothetical protein
MFKPSAKQIAEYYQKSVWISETLQSLNQQGRVAQYGEDAEDYDRIIETNHNNFEALQYAVQSGVLPGRTVFWLIKKTVDMNHKSVSSWTKR